MAWTRIRGGGDFRMTQAGGDRTNQSPDPSPVDYTFFSRATSASILVKVWITRSSGKTNEPHSFR